MEREEHPVPAWLVVGAGTGGTSATLGRYVRYRRLPTQICLADPVQSVFHQHLKDRSICTAPLPMSCVEGIGRPRCEPSFIPALIDRAEAITDAQSAAAARVLSRHTGKACGGSTGTNFWAVARLVSEMQARGETGSIVTLLCDSGERYRSTLMNDDWLACRELDISAETAALNRFLATGTLLD